MLEGEYIKNNTRFCKPSRFNESDLIKRNIIFIYSDTIKEDIDNLLKEDGINTIRLTSHNYKLDNIDFLKDYDLSFIESIDLLSDSITNIDGIYSLKNLKHINSEKSKIDYTQFEHLKSVGIELVDSNNIETLSKMTTLERLSLLNKYSKIKYLVKLPKLKFLQLEAKKIDSFKFLDSLNELELVGIHNLLNESEDGDKKPLIKALKRTNGQIW